MGGAGVKMALHLGPVRADEMTGALRLAPPRGSCREPLHSRLRGMGVAQHTEDLLSSFACDSTPGDVVMFDMRCFHSSVNGGPKRRMCSIVYYNNPRCEAEEKATRERHERCTQAVHAAPLHDEHELARHAAGCIGAVPKTCARNAAGSSQRAYWIWRTGALGYLGENWVAELARL